MALLQYLDTIQTLCHLSNSDLKVEKHRLSQELLAARTAPPAPPSSQIKANQAPTEIPTQVQSGPVTPPLHHSITPSLQCNPLIHHSTNPLFGRLCWQISADLDAPCSLTI
jgi:hypothetical protein